ncbi:hypothetical protein [Robinsoniella peoriensis]|uniref:hypothetical protein n=1 Tax=Robinsoniella peoriensis TaxID=180332 RepID=UPI00085C4415|nr:hypothetical protein [Robinsoniella peoriensis]MDU7031273.1 hypothetical protein [Clostridiales bacterium]
MIDVLSIVHTRLKVTISKVCGNTGTTNSGAPPAFPFLYVCQEDNYSTSEDLDNNENAVVSVIKLESYSKKSVTEAKKIMALANDEMRNMGYQRKYGPQEVMNVADTKIKRVVARFQRLVCNDDEI